MFPYYRAFDSQTEMVTADIDTNVLPAVEHVISVHAIERDNKWGPFGEVNFSLNSTGQSGTKMGAPGFRPVYLMIGLILAYLVILRSKI